MMGNGQDTQAPGQNSNSPWAGLHLINAPGLSTGPRTDRYPVKAELKKQGPRVNGASYHKPPLTQVESHELVASRYNVAIGFISGIQCY